MCQGLRNFIQPPGSAKGLKSLMIFNKKSFARRTIVVYGTEKKQDVLVEYCPFCGGELCVDEEQEDAPCPKK